MRRTISLLTIRRQRMTLTSLAISAPSVAQATSVRFQQQPPNKAPSGGNSGGAGIGFNRSEETFLSQYDPLDVLMLNESVQRSDVEAAYTSLCSEYGPQGKRPDPKKLERVQQAYEILKDSSSIYYQRAQAREDFKHRLAYQFLDVGHRRMAQLRATFAFILLGAVFIGSLGFAFQPFKKIQRAALQR